MSEQHRAATPPRVPPEFWRATDAIKAALASRHIGRVIRAYRTHFYHGHPLPQGAVAGWLGITQPQLSRMETGPRVDRLDQLIHCARVLRIPSAYLWFALPDEHEAAVGTALRGAEAEVNSPAEFPPDLEDLGPSSSSRTKTLVEALHFGRDPRLRYVPPIGAIDRIIEFLGSPSRVYVIKGAPGCGKSSLAHHATEDLSGSADFQLHSLGSWDIDGLDLAAEILRYSSIPQGSDPLIRLEGASVALRRPCVVVIDGLKGQDEVNNVGRQLDNILRQVTEDTLRFLLIIRTPPDVEVCTYPLLAASIYELRNEEPGASYWISPWTHVEARDVWDSSREGGEPAFHEFPASVQSLARVPLYMRLLKLAGYATSPANDNSYRLVDFCVRSILRTSGLDVEQAMRELEDVAQSQLPGLVPDLLVARRRPSAGEERSTAALPLPLVRISPTGQLAFDHDVLCEYFVATRIAALMVERGRSVATVGAFNDLARRAGGSAMARGVFEFVVCCLDRSLPDVLTSVALSPTVGIHTTLPLLLKVASSGCEFPTNDVLRTCARRCFREAALELARSLLATPRIASALGEEHASWVTGLLRTFGAAVWPDVARSIEQTLDAAAASALLAATDLHETDEAAFFARHFFLLFGDDEDLTGPLADLVGHPDWRVRAALAEGLRDHRSPSNVSARLIVDRLARDDDYKVRAAVAMAFARLAPEAAERYLGDLLVDDNWHVRGCVLHGLLSTEAGSVASDVLARTAATVVTSEPSWRHCPVHIAPLVERLLLITGAPPREGTVSARHHAVFTLLREARTGWARLPAAIQETLVAEGCDSEHWLVRRETRAAQEWDDRAGSGILLHDPALRRETFRRLRDRRSVQVALDLHDLDQAVAVATAAASAGADLIEVGDPLIKAVGLAAIERIKRAVPHTAIVAEMMSADWGRDQVERAAVMGADVVLLIGPATVASVASAVDAGRRLGVPVLLDVPAGHATNAWVRDMERVGVDGLAITTNIDVGMRGRHPLEKARVIRSWTRLPVAVSGGFGPTDYLIFNGADWDILIIGRSITDAVEPASAASRLIELVHRG